MNLLDLLFPKTCIGCKKFGRYFCSDCVSEIRQTELVCPFCERPSLGGVVHSVCQRRNTTPQMKLLSHERKKNIKNAFALLETRSEPRVTNNVLLIDDVWTTGSTLKECCYILKRGGAKTVWALTIAR